MILQAMEAEERDKVFQAWLSYGYGRSFGEYLEERKPKKQKTEEDILAETEAMMAGR